MEKIFHRKTLVATYKLKVKIVANNKSVIKIRGVGENNIYLRRITY